MLSAESIEPGKIQENDVKIHNDNKKIKIKVTKYTALLKKDIDEIKKLSDNFCEYPFTLLKALLEEPSSDHIVLIFQKQITANHCRNLFQDFFSQIEPITKFSTLEIYLRENPQFKVVFSNKTKAKNKTALKKMLSQHKKKTSGHSVVRSVITDYFSKTINNKSTRINENKKQVDPSGRSEINVIMTEKSIIAERHKIVISRSVDCNKSKFEGKSSILDKSSISSVIPSQNPSNYRTEIEEPEIKKILKVHTITEQEAAIENIKGKFF